MNVGLELPKFPPCIEGATSWVVLMGTLGLTVLATWWFMPFSYSEKLMKCRQTVKAYLGRLWHHFCNTNMCLIALVHYTHGWYGVCSGCGVMAVSKKMSSLASCSTPKLEGSNSNSLAQCHTSKSSNVAGSQPITRRGGRLIWTLTWRLNPPAT